MKLIPEVCSSTVKMPLTNSDLFFYIDKKNYEKFKNYTCRLNDRGYVVSSSTCYTGPIYIHKRIAKLYNQNFVDHIDKMPRNCTEINLRPISIKNNGLNRYKNSNNTSGFIGVSYRKDIKKFAAYANNLEGRRIHLGFFNTPEEAARARDRYMIKFYLEFATLNFPISDYIKSQL